MLLPALCLLDLSCLRICISIVPADVGRIYSALFININSCTKGGKYGFHSNFVGFLRQDVLKGKEKLVLGIHNMSVY